MLNVSKIWRSLAASALVGGTLATMVPALPASAAVSAVSFTPVPATTGLVFAGGLAPTAAYTVAFTNATAVPAGGHIVITFPSGLAGTGGSGVSVPSAALLPVPTIGGAGAGMTLTVASVSGQVVTLTTSTVQTAAGAVTLSWPSFVSGFVNPNIPGLYSGSVGTTDAASVVLEAAVSSGATMAITGLGASASPNTPAAAAQYNFTFTSTATLTNNVDFITIKVPTATNTTNTAIGALPTIISRSNVVVSGTTTVPNAAASVQSPSTDPVVDTQAGTITIKVPNMTIGNPSSGPDLAAGVITVSFSAAAGLTNSAGAASLVFSASTSTPGFAAVQGVVVIPRILQLNATNGARGTNLTISGLGYSNGSVTLWADNGKGGGIACNGVVDGGEQILQQNVTVANRVFTTTIIVGSSFVPGPTNCVFALDSTGGKSSAPAAIPEPTFTLNPSIGTITPTSGTIGTSVAIGLLDYTPGTTCFSFKFGANATVTGCAGATLTNSVGTTVVAPDGTGTVTLLVPGGVLQGVNSVNVKTNGGLDSASKNFTVNGAALTVTPTTLVANEKVLIQGTGFNTSVGIASVTIGGTALAACPPVTVPAYTTDSGGTASFTCTLPSSLVLPSAGTYDLRVTDASPTSINGSLAVTIPSPTLVISPATSAAGSTITYSGTGMAAGLSVTVSYPYPAVGGSTQAISVADSSGNYSGSLTIPTTPAVVIPSTNTVGAVSGSLSATVQHNIPASSLKVTPTTAAPGDTVTITGTNFASFTGVTSLKIGDLGVSVNAVNTDASGNFTATVLVPGLTAGSANVVAAVGGNTASTVLTITAQASSVPATTALAGLVNTQNLNIVTSFNYASGVYQAYVPNLGGNTLVSISPNTVLFITMTKDTTVIVSGISYAVKANVPTPIGVGAVVSVGVQ